MLLGASAAAAGTGRTPPLRHPGTHSGMHCSRSSPRQPARTSPLLPRARTKQHPLRWEVPSEPACLPSREPTHAPEVDTGGDDDGDRAGAGDSILQTLDSIAPLPQNIEARGTGTIIRLVEPT